MKTAQSYLVLGILVGSWGCATTYEPTSNRRLSATTYTYVKDGVEYDRGFFGGKLRELTEDIPEAHSYAAAMHTNAILGFVLQMASVAAVGPYIAVAVEDDPGSAGALGIALTSTALGIVAGIFEARRVARETDALNAYNDARPPPAAHPMDTETASTAPSMSGFREHRKALSPRYQNSTDPAETLSVPAKAFSSVRFPNYLETPRPASP